MRIDRRTFLLLIAATTGVTATVKSQPRCSNCGQVIRRGSRAQQLADLGDYPEDALCLECQAASITHEEAAALLLPLLYPRFQYEGLVPVKHILAKVVAKPENARWRTISQIKTTLYKKGTTPKMAGVHSPGRE